MNKIMIDDIDFSKLEKSKHQGSKSIMFEDDVLCYKMLTGLNDDEKAILCKKLFDMDGIHINGVYLPIDLIMKNDKLEGFTLNKFKNSIPLYDAFSGQFIDFKLLFIYISKACKILREIHDYGIVCQDLSFENILVDNNGNVGFCDLDGCYYNGYFGPFVSTPIKKLIVEYRGEDILVCKNLDRVSMVVSLYYLIYNKYLHLISTNKLRYLAENVETMQRLLIYTEKLMDKTQPISQIPYLDEMIILDDEYIMNRKTQFSLLRRILRK